MVRKSEAYNYKTQVLDEHFRTPGNVCTFMLQQVGKLDHLRNWSRLELPSRGGGGGYWRRCHQLSKSPRFQVDESLTSFSNVFSYSLCKVSTIFYSRDCLKGRLLAIDCLNLAIGLVISCCSQQSA